MSDYRDDRKKDGAYRKNTASSAHPTNVSKPQMKAASSKPVQQPVQKKAKRRRMNPLLYLLCVLLVSAVLAGVGWVLASDLCAFNKKELETVVTVSADDTVATIADKLHEAGLIRYKWFFRLFAAIAHADEKIGAGTYNLNTEMDYRALIMGMRNSSGNLNSESIRVTIPEGYTVQKIIDLLAEKQVSTRDALLDAAQNYDFDFDFIDNSTQDISRLEGYLFPDTYDFYSNEKPASALKRLLTNFTARLDEERMDLIDGSDYNLKEIITIASLIEKETDGSDQANIASVIYNRLRDSSSQSTYKMLEIDASLLYALPDHQGPITSSDMEIKSPYNLYTHAGLPPTPIANPGLDSIDAALLPNTTDYHYYALGKNGKHHFSQTLEEHRAFVNSSEYAGNG